MKNLLCIFTIFLGTCVINTHTVYATITVDQVNSCNRNILELFEQYCDDEGLRTSNDVTATPSWGEYKLSDGKINIGCYKYKKSKYQKKLKEKLVEKCGFLEDDVIITTPTRPEITITWPIQGRVIDSKGALVGANVYIQNSKASSGSVCGNTADLDGYFKISNCIDVPAAPQLIISFIGYTTKEIPLSSFTNGQTITMSEEETILDEALVVACKIPDPDYPGATDLQYNEEKKDCYPIECNEPEYKLVGTAGTKNAKCEPQKCKIDNATVSHWETTDMKQWVCIADDCKEGYKKNTDETACIKMLKKCTDEQKSAHPNATETGIKEGTNPEQCIALECECGYDLVDEKCVQWPATGKKCTADTKPDLPSHATGAIMKCNTKGKAYCEVTGCENNYTQNDSNTKCEKLRGECTHNDPNVKKAKYKTVNGNRICVITKCNDGYMPSEDGQKCEVSEGPCNEAQLATVENATKGELKKGKCHATECKPGYEVEKHKCVEIEGNCDPKPENAKKSHREFDSNTQAEVCIIDECKNGYKVSDDSKSCIEIEKPKLSQEDSKKKIDELQKNADAMKEKEQSTANKLLGGAAIGATGIGAMQAASAYSEQQADEEAEQAMKAYLATFYCNYGGGINVQGGEKEVQLPGGNELINLYAEYVNLANNLKVRKAALDMRPGIESEAILDSATSGLYDDVAIGKTSGAFTSLARALMDPEGEDAKAWAAQKDDSAQKMKTGLTMAGIGAVGGAVGNLLINKNSEKENSKEINAKYEKLKKKMEQVQTVVDTLPKPTCNDFISQGVNGGTYPNCTCSNTAARFFAEQGCITCETGKQYNEQNECVAIPPAGCTKDGVLSPGTCDCVANATLNGNTCECNAGYENKNGICEQIPTTPPTTAPKTEEQTIKLDIPADVTFESGKSTLKTEAKTKIAQAITEALSGKEGASDIKSFKIEITGHTDRVPFKRGSSMTNQKLSESRANTIKQLFVDAGVKEQTITTSGKADTECVPETTYQRNDARCRKVVVTITVNSDTGLDDILQDINIGELAGKIIGSTTTK